jgi:hypothetical protein
MIDYIIPFLISYSILIPFIVTIRKYFLPNKQQNLKLITQVDRLKLSRSKEHYLSQEMPVSKGLLQRNGYEIKVLSSSTGGNKSNIRQSE